MSEPSTTAAVPDTTMAKALSHPVRVQALRILNQRVASPSDIAVEIGLPVANVAYHVRALLQLGCVEEVETRPVRGALEHFYRAVRRPLIRDDEWEQLPATARQGLTATAARECFRALAAAMAAGRLDALSESHVSSTELRLDERGWTELAQLLEGLLDRALAMQGECAARLSDGEAGGREIRSHLGILSFEAAAAADAQ